MLSLSLVRFIPMLRHRSFIATGTASVTLISNGSITDRNNIITVSTMQSRLYTTLSYDSATGTGNDKTKFVYYQLYADKTTLGQVSKVNVINGDDIIGIKEAIKKDNSPESDNVPIQKIGLFESVDDIEQRKLPLDGTIEWNPNVTWGTENTPLIVQFWVRISPWSYSNGEC